jgi:hypothetical protein
VEVALQVVKDNPELQAQIAALRIQNTFRSKLMARLESQWKSRLEESASAAEDRERALRVSVGVVCGACLGDWPRS